MTDDEVQLIYDYLHENYRYEDGELIRKKITRGGKIGGKAGTLYLAGNKAPQNKMSLTVDGTSYVIDARKIMYLYHHKFIPSRIKNIDGNYFNLKIENLKASSINKTGFKGVYPNKKRFSSAVCINGHVIRLGTFDTPEEAHAAYLKAKEEYKS